VNKFGCRPVSMVGAVLSAFGFAISTLSPNIDVMMLTYGIIGGMTHFSLYSLSLLLIALALSRFIHVFEIQISLQESLWGGSECSNRCHLPISVP